MKYKLLILFGIFLVIIFGFFYISDVLAFDFQNDSGLKKTADKIGYEGTGGTNPENMIVTKIGEIIKIFLSLLGIIFFMLIVYGGYTWMMAGGNEQNVEKAKKIITNAVIGLIIVAAAYAVTAFITNTAKHSTNNEEHTVSNDPCADCQEPTFTCINGECVLAQ